jgi:Brp/Blh family beta-carotene 15,15'-monooxygenase
MPLVHKSLLTIAALAIGFLAVAPALETGIAFFLILAFGIPHGATDHAVFNFLTRGRVQAAPQLGFLLAYLGVMVLYGVLWYFLPGFSLLVFLLVSAYHFGETQLLRYEIKGFRRWCAYFFQGMTVLLLIFLPNLAEVQAYIVPELVGAGVFAWVEAHVYLLLGIGGLGWVLSMPWRPGKALLREVAELGLIFLIAWNASLLLSFAVFFAFWHSRDAAWLQIVRLRRREKGFDLRRWVKLALPYTLMSLAGMGGIVLCYSFASFSLPLVTFFFILVALITLPHVLVMSVFYHRGAPVPDLDATAS